VSVFKGRRLSLRVWSFFTTYSSLAEFTRIPSAAARNPPSALLTSRYFPSQLYQVVISCSWQLQMLYMTLFHSESGLPCSSSLGYVSSLAEFTRIPSAAARNPPSALLTSRYFPSQLYITVISCSWQLQMLYMTLFHSESGLPCSSSLGYVC
jgi:hypothetical protein